MTKKDEAIIRFQAQVWNIKTLVDGGINVTLALSDKDIKQVAQLLECKKNNALLEVAAVPIKPELKKVKTNDHKKRAERYPYHSNE